MAKSRLSRNGLLLKDMDILVAMDHTLTGRFIPVKLGKDGMPDKKSENSLLSLEAMGNLMKEIDGIVKSIGQNIRRGKADIAPMTEKGSSPCEYCEMKAICRKT